MAGMVKRVAPLTYEAWVDFDLCGAKMSFAELTALRTILEPAEEGGIRIRRGTGAVDRASLAGLGLSPREIRELLEKLEPREKPDFELDLTAMRSAESVSREMAEAAPRLS